MSTQSILADFDERFTEKERNFINEDYWLVLKDDISIPELKSFLEKAIEESYQEGYSDHQKEMDKKLGYKPIQKGAK